MSILDTLTNPSMLHAALVHLPIALSMLGLPLVLLSAWLHKNATLRLLAVGLYVLMAATSYVAEETGEDARGKIPVDISSEIAHVVSDHEELAEKVKGLAAVTAVLLLLCFVNQESFRRAVSLFACCGALASAILVALAAHHGGELVYVHGIGTGLMDDHAARQPKLEEGEAGSEDWIPIRAVDMAAAKAVSYTRDIVPIFEDRCYSCHESPDPDGDYDMTTIENLLKAGEKAGPGIVPGEPDESSVVQYIRGILQPRMPKKKAPLSEDDLHTIRLWIAAGAIDDTATAAPAAEPDPEPARPLPAAAPAPAAPATETPAPAEAPFDPFG